jgi:DNA-binding IclR family transcriptional regulator
LTDKNYTVPALQKGLQIIEMFDGQTRRLTRLDMAKALQVTAGSLYRITQTLVGMGYLRKIDNNSYELGSQVISRGFSYLVSREISEIAAPFITNLRNITSLSSHLAIREGNETVYVFRALALQILAVNVPIGTRFPCHTTAMGRALLTDLSPTEIEFLYHGQRLDGYPAPAPQTLPDLIELCKIEKEQGWSVHNSDYSFALAMPIKEYTGKVIAAINVSIPDAILKKGAAQQRLIEMLKETVNNIENEMGGIK